MVTGTLVMRLLPLTGGANSAQRCTAWIGAVNSVFKIFRKGLAAHFSYRADLSVHLCIETFGNFITASLSYRPWLWRPTQ